MKKSQEPAVSVADEWYEIGFKPSVPASLDEAWLDEEIARQGLMLEQVDTELTERVRASYGAFVEAMEELQRLERAAVGAGRTVTGGRDHLRLLEVGMVAPGLRLLRYRRRQERQQALLEVLQHLMARQEELVSARALLERQQYRECLESLPPAPPPKEAPKAEAGLYRQAEELREQVPFLFFFFFFFLFLPLVLCRCARGCSREKGFWVGWWGLINGTRSCLCATWRPCHRRARRFARRRSACKWCIGHCFATVIETLEEVPTSK